MSEAAAVPAENSSENSTKPVPGRPFQKGRSGNPGGRPKGLAKAVRDKLDTAAADAAAASPDDERLAGQTGADLLVNFWTGVMADPKMDVQHRLKASQFLSERGWGKAPAFAPVEEQDPLDLSEEVAEAVAAGFDVAMDELAERRKAAAESVAS